MRDFTNPPQVTDHCDLWGISSEYKFDKLKVDLIIALVMPYTIFRRPHMWCRMCKSMSTFKNFYCNNKNL